MRKAEVYLYGNLAGFIEEMEPRGYRFWYDANYLAKSDSIPLSPLMPLSNEVVKSEALPAFFDGLIPEGWLLDIAEKTALRACSSYAGEDTERYMALLLFCFIIGNSDMHLKNFSLIREHDGEWHLSKAYDLVPVKTVMPNDQDDLALTINGKNRNLTASDFAKACEPMHLTPVQFKRTVKRITKQTNRSA